MLVSITVGRVGSLYSPIFDDGVGILDASSRTQGLLSGLADGIGILDLATPSLTVGGGSSGSFGATFGPTF
jgi:hypothetical protein